jgi:hypothetical protein
MSNTIELFEQMIDLLDPNPCKGLLFRGRVNNYCQNTKIVWRQELHLLKRRSCSGCDKCWWIFDELHEQQMNGVILPQNGIEDGMLYRIRTTNHSRDWETGIIDDYDLIVEKVTD